MDGILAGRPDVHGKEIYGGYVEVTSASPTARLYPTNSLNRLVITDAVITAGAVSFAAREVTLKHGSTTEHVIVSTSGNPIPWSMGSSWVLDQGEYIELSVSGMAVGDAVQLNVRGYEERVA